MQLKSTDSSRPRVPAALSPLEVIAAYADADCSNALWPVKLIFFAVYFGAINKNSRLLLRTYLRRA